MEKDSETPRLQMLSSLSDGTCKSEGESLVQKGIFLQYRLAIYLQILSKINNETEKNESDS